MALQAKIAVYARKSKLTETGKSVENQISKCIAYARLKFDAADSDIEIYRDEGKSGFYSDRPEYLRMLSDIENGKVRAVICYKFDRISRRTVDLLNLVEMLKAKGVPFVSCTDDVDTGSKTGKILMSMLAAIAEFERDIIAERISDNLYELAKEGRWLGGTTPTGFYSKKERISVNGRNTTINHLEPIEEELSAVKSIFQTYLEKHSLQAVVSFTRENNILTKEGNEHTRVSIKTILSNPVYAVADSDIYNYFTEKDIRLYAKREDFNGTNGLMVYNKTEQVKELRGESSVFSPEYARKKKRRSYEEWIISVGKHKGIISGRDWIAAQKMLTDNLSRYSRPHNKSKALLSGLLACPICGKNMYTHTETGRFEKNGEQRFLYKCPTRRDNPDLCCCKAIRGKVIDDFVLEAVCRLDNGNTDSYYAALERELKNGALCGISSKIDTIKGSILKIQKDINSQIQNLREASESVKPYILADIDELTKKLDIMQKQLSGLEVRQNDNVIALEGLTKARKLISSFAELIDAMTYEEKLELIRLVVAKVYLVRGEKGDVDTVHIFLKVADEKDYIVRKAI